MKSLGHHAYFAVLCAAAFVSGIKFEVIGTLYAADLVILVLFLQAVGAGIPGYLGRRSWILLLAIGLLPIFGIGFDLYHRIPQADFFRGFARNSVFVFSAASSVFLIHRLTPRRWAAIASLFYASVPLAAIYQTPEVLDWPIALCKYQWGAYMLLPIICLLGRVPWLAAIITIWVGIVQAILFDTRSFGILWIAAGIWALLDSHKTVQRRFAWRLFFVSALAAVVCLGAVFYYSDYFETSIVQRRLLSDSVRWEMASDAWERFLESPLEGYGSWQHARLFMLEATGSTLISVHSWILHLAFEYGITGLLVGLLIFAIPVLAAWRLITGGAIASLLQSRSVVCYLIILEGIYVPLMSPFSGPGRIFQGFAVGLSLSILSADQKQDCLSKPVVVTRSSRIASAGGFSKALGISTTDKSGEQLCRRTDRPKVS